MVSTNSENSQPLIRLARRRAFELYLRNGRKPDAPLLAERKDVGSALASAAAERGTPTSHYVWRTMLDDRVRRRHVEREGHVFARAEPPVGGPPGTEPNCRCWAEPYYGDPAVPDALQPLAHAYHTDPTGSAPWASIETLTRSDGSLAQSIVLTRDGTQVRSTFSGTLVSRQITLPTGDVVRVNTSGGVQSISLGDDPRLLLQSAWTARGPRVIRARQHLAFLGDEQTVIDPEVGAGPGTSARERYLTTLVTFGSGSMAFALLALYSILRAAPASQGLAEKDEPVAVAKTWSFDLLNTTPVLIDVQAEERFRQNCKNRDVIELWAIEAMATAAAYRDVATPQNFGIRAHKLLKDKVDAMSRQFPGVYGNLAAEISYVDNNEMSVPYGTKGSSRLDVLEDRRSDMGAVCVYDMKTGMEGLTVARLRRIGGLVSRVFPGASVFYVTQLGPMMAKNRAR